MLVHLIQEKNIYNRNKKIIKITLKKNYLNQSKLIYIIK
jgi:hypothetical protein